ncbi:hypothetical protein CJ030_MR0G027764 [Morella rubra]|uniref:Uncharacterized protein n=1 Tax=Morella rubra TaxID=262757 RepID=A0A6A1UIV0_9ROSI|nr:hypothetical protein CJ030_MR0G027782 [Morella rubra]KAB1199088.1 hypothetical protein CJ030_MR0G027764 [Morella rubra]
MTNKVYEEEITAFPKHEQYMTKKVEIFDEMTLVVEKQVASSSKKCHTKTSKAKSDKDGSYAILGDKIERVVIALEKMIASAYINDLYAKIMKIEGFEKDLLALAFEYLAINETRAKIFMAKNVHFRKI